MSGGAFESVPAVYLLDHTEDPKKHTCLCVSRRAHCVCTYVRMYIHLVMENRCQSQSALGEKRRGECQRGRKGDLSFVKKAILAHLESSYSSPKSASSLGD